MRQKEYTITEEDVGAKAYNYAYVKELERYNKACSEQYNEDARRIAELEAELASARALLPEKYHEYMGRIEDGAIDLQARVKELEGLVSRMAGFGILHLPDNLANEVREHSTRIITKETEEL